MEAGSVADIIRVQAGTRGDAVALEFEGRSITFGELDRRSNQAANALRAAGVVAQDRVAFIDRNRPEYFEVAFGVAKLNGINLGVNWRLSPAEMAQVIADAQATVLVIGPDFVGHIEQIRDQLPTVTTIITMDVDGESGYEQWLAAQADDDPGGAPAADDIAFLIYTSGTTGLPKGVMMTHAGFFHAFKALDSWRLDAESVPLAMMPMFHFAGSGWSLLSLSLGCRTVLLRDVDPVRILEAIPAFGITNVIMPPAVIQFILGAPGVEQVDFSSLRAIIYGAAPISETLLVRAIEVLGCEFIQVYGLTEAAGCVVQLDNVDHDPANPARLRSCGKPFPWVELRVVDPESGTDVPAGRVGELWLRSAGIMRGYWNNPSATAEALTPDGWLRTGDAGYLDGGGYLFLSDRVKDMIVSGGENVYPAEVENALMKHPAVADVAVVGVPDDRWGEAVKAVVVFASGQVVAPDELIAFARRHLAGYKLPKSVDVADELPRNATGKVLRRVLREPYWAGRQRRVG